MTRREFVLHVVVLVILGLALMLGPRQMCSLRIQIRNASTTTTEVGR